MTAHPRATRLALLAFSLVALPSAFAATSNQVGGSWDLYGESKAHGNYHGTVGVTEGTGGKLDLTFDFTYDVTGEHVTLTGTGTRTGSKVDYELPLSTGISDKVGSVVSGEDAKDPGKIVGTMWLTTSGRILWTHWKNTGDGSTGEERLRRTKQDPGQSSVPAEPKPAPKPPETKPPVEPETPPPTKDIITLVDGNGSDVPAAKKNTDGVIVPLDLDQGSAHHLLPVKLKKPAGTPDGATYQLAPSANLALWSDANKTKKAGSSLPAADVTLYVEGLHSSASDAGETLGVQLLSAEKAVAQDHGKVTVARSAFLLLGHGSAGSWHLDDYLSAHKVDGRTDPVLVKGKDESGKPTAWAVWRWQSKKGATLALSTEKSVVAYDGHSNFGLGYAFETNHTSISQFMLISDAQVPVNWEYLRDHQEHPNLMIADSEYGDDSGTRELYDPVEVPKEIEGDHGSYATHRFPPSGGDGNRCHLTRGSVKWLDYHYALPGDDGKPDLTNTRIVVKSGARDMPAKKWSRLYLHSCYSGPYYYDSFGGQGAFFFTTDEAAVGSDCSSVFIESCVEGKANEDVLKALNAVENLNDFHVFSQ